MRAKEFSWSSSKNWSVDLSESDRAGLVLYFGARRANCDKAH